MPRSESESGQYLMTEDGARAPARSPDALEIGQQADQQQPLTVKDWTAHANLDSAQENGTASEELHPEEPFSYHALALKLALTLLLFVTLTVLLDTLAEKEIMSFAAFFMGKLGKPGLFVLVYLCDALPQPMTYVPLIFLAVKAKVKKEVVFLICGLASYSAALTGYFIGQNLRRIKCVDERFRQKLQVYPQIADLMSRKGARGVALAALLPFPFALATWTAGSFGVNFQHFLLASLARLIKIGGFVLLSS